MDLEHEQRLTAVEARAKSNAHRLDDVEKRQDDLADLVGTVKVLAEREARVEGDVQEIKADVRSIKDKPGKKWEAFWEKILWAIVAAILGFLLAELGLSQ